MVICHLKRGKRNREMGNIPEYFPLFFFLYPVDFFLMTDDYFPVSKIWSTKKSRNRHEAIAG